MTKEPDATEILTSLLFGTGPSLFLTPVLVLDLIKVLGLGVSLSYWTCMGALFAFECLTAPTKAPSAKTKYVAGDLYNMTLQRAILFMFAAVLIYWVL